MEILFETAAKSPDFIKVWRCLLPRRHDEFMFIPLIELSIEEYSSLLFYSNFVNLLSIIHR